MYVCVRVCVCVCVYIYIDIDIDVISLRYVMLTYAFRRMLALRSPRQLMRRISDSRRMLTYELRRMLTYAGAAPPAAAVSAYADVC